MFVKVSAYFLIKSLRLTAFFSVEGSGENSKVIYFFQLKFNGIITTNMSVIDR